MGAANLPTELRCLIVEELGWIDSSSSIALVWRESWHRVRIWRFKYVEFDDWQGRAVLLPKLLDILAGNPCVSQYIKDIHITATPYWRTDDGFCKNISSLITLATQARKLCLCGPFHSVIPSNPLEYPPNLSSTLQSAFQKSSFRTLCLDEYGFTTPDQLDRFISLFSSVESLEMRNIHNTSNGPDSSLWTQSLPKSHKHFVDLTLPYEHRADVALVHYIANGSAYPDVQ